MREYLKLTRAHTAPLEVVPAAGGALLATGGSVTYGVVFWAFYGLLYHLTGYGHNSLRDWEKGYDMDDPNKQHHPLNTGEISPTKASLFIYGMLAVTFFYALAGSLYYRSGLAVIVLIIGIGFGLAYNEYGKTTLLKPVLISVAHSTVFAIPFIAINGSITNISVAAWILVFLWVMFQIGISGEIKDIKQDEANLLKEYGYTVVDDEVIPGRRAKTLALMLRSYILVTAFAVLSLQRPSMDVYISAGAFLCMVTFVSVARTRTMMVEDVNDRDRCLKHMAHLESDSMVMFIIAISPSIGIITSAAIFMLSGIWIVAFNKIQWNTTLKPEV